MDENKIYKIVFEEIKDSLDWIDDPKDDHYYNFIDGVIALANRMIKEINRTSDIKESE
jgi:hypothetical protein